MSNFSPELPVFSNDYQQIFNEEEDDYAQYVNPTSSHTSSFKQAKPSSVHVVPTKSHFKWQWRSDSGWRDYQKMHSKNIEERYGNKDKVTITIGNTSYCIDFKQLKQFNLDSNNARSIRRAPLHGSNEPPAASVHGKHVKQPASGHSGAATWQVQLGGSWSDYDASASKFIESNFASNTSYFECTVRGQSYFIDLALNVQINLDTGKSRAIRRVDAGNTLQMNDKVMFGLGVGDDDYKQGVSVQAANSDIKHDDGDRDMVQQMSAMSISSSNHSRQQPQFQPQLVGDQNSRERGAYKWQWMNDEGVFTDYDRDASQQMEVLHNSNAKSYLYKSPKNGQVYSIDFETLTQRNNKTDAVRPIRRCRRSTKPHASSPHNGNTVKHSSDRENGMKIMKWQWFDVDGRVFVDYDKQVSKDIEVAYQQRKSGHQFVSDKTKANYRVDFKSMQQVNSHSKMKRDVRRVPLSVKPQKPQKPHASNVHSGPDPKTWKGPKQSARRKVFGNKMMTLYHVTDTAAADSIWKERKMIRGSAGMFGGGIYFAESVAAAKYKAQRQGVLITAKVFVGKEHVVQNGFAGHFSFQEMQKMGCDSVYAPNGSGGGQPERVVYNFDQVCVISKKPS